MSLTQNCDIYVAIKDEGINRTIQLIMQQRPSLFNYGTNDLNSHPSIVCNPIDAHGSVRAAGNPLLTPIKPVPVVGSSPNSFIPACFQINDFKIDFYKNDQFTMPQEISLNNQQLAVYTKISVGLGCPTPDELRSFLESIKIYKRIPDFRREIFIPTRNLNCFSLEFFATTSMKLGPSLAKLSLEDFEIKDLTPTEMENMIECYVMLVAKLMLPQIEDMLLKEMVKTRKLPDPPDPSGPEINIKISPSAQVPNNPASEDDQLKLFLNIDYLTMAYTISQLSGSGPKPITKIEKPRIRTGPSDMTVAISEDGFKKIFQAAIQGIKFSFEDTIGSTFTIHYKIVGKLKGGSINFENNYMEIKELDIFWETFKITFGVDVPTIPIIPSGCLDIPFDGTVCSPGYSLFTKNPDLSIPIDVSGFTSEVTVFRANLKTWYTTYAGGINKWEFHLDPLLPIQIDFVDLADTIADKLEDFLDNVINILSIPSWAKAAVDAAKDLIIDTIRAALDIPSDILAWVQTLLVDVLDLNDNIWKWIKDFFDVQVALFAFEDPLTVLPETDKFTHIPALKDLYDPVAINQTINPPLVPVKLPIEYIGIEINNNELIVKADIGATI
ncbi:hypothetical protein [Candidatus Nitrosocosmicus sp. SS]|uniref:hypothetical protein n=1 Tax=Candidatus Nitrosocosmicus agrestis TaxID=2563600 RepID=UPI00122E4C97|nr:hypothetical protein [Candidatus Nitrosocosmicus sp. SS]KAA2283731.1 hypothetical protein F1Z66_00110 [Candidatus Nitrosocosmicus sp. SS]KAF0870108.1 hypothetical protein E5N71_00835 [Candidatus Nitrosocosmicus sp. SS]